MGEASDAYDPVRRISGVGSVTTFSGDHLVSIEDAENGVLGIVSVSGSCYTIDFGGGQRIGRHAAMSRRDGSRSSLADEEAGGNISTTLREHIRQKAGASDQ